MIQDFKRNLLIIWALTFSLFATSAYIQENSRFDGKLMMESGNIVIAISFATSTMLVFVVGMLTLLT